jgi:hypothetical protein
MKFKGFIFLIFAALMFSACQPAQDAAPPANSANQQARNTAVLPANTNQAELPANSAVNTTIANVTEYAAEANPAQQPASPVGTFKALADAANNKDNAALKQLFNKKSLDMAASEAKEKGRSLDEILLNQQIVLFAKGTPEIRNQIITGDSATIEIKTDKMRAWQKVFFTNEDGRWKLAMDKYMEEIMRQVEAASKELEQMGNEGKDK